MPRCSKAPQKALPPVYEPRWTAWGGAYGGSNRTSGDLAVIGSHDVSARTVGVAGGLDYRLTPDTVVGFAFAGGGTDWNLSQGLGGGKSDAFQAGVYGATRPARPTRGRLRLHQPLDVDRPVLLRRRPPHCEVQRAEPVDASKAVIVLDGCIGDHALCGDPGAKFPHAGLRRD